QLCSPPSLGEAKRGSNPDVVIPGRSEGPNPESRDSGPAPSEHPGMTEEKLHAARIIRGFARDGDVVDVAFAQARAGDADELRLLVEFRQIARADIAHRRSETTGELVHHVADRALVGHLALDALGDQLQRVLDVLLKVAVGRAARHRTDRAHAAI